MNASINDYLKNVPWAILVISLSVSICIFLLAIYLCNLGGGWIIIGVTLGVPSFIVILSWAKRIFGVVKTALFFRTTFGMPWFDSGKNENAITENSSQDVDDRLSVLYFKSTENAFLYALECMKYDPDQCIGLIKNYLGFDPVHSVHKFTVSVDDGKGRVCQGIAFQHPSFERDLQIGDLTGMELVSDKDAIKEVGLKGIAKKFYLINSKLKPEYSFEGEGWVVE